MTGSMLALARKPAIQAWSHDVLRRGDGRFVEHDAAPLAARGLRLPGHEYGRVPVHSIEPQVSQSELIQNCPLAPQRCPFGGACHSCPLQVQTKLMVSQPGDPYEQEADRVADRVMSMPEPCLACGDKSEEAVHARPVADQITPFAQRQVKPDKDEEEGVPVQTKSLVQRQTESAEEEENAFQTKSLAHQPRSISPALATRIQSLRGGGQPLPGQLRAFFEPRFGYDLGDVRVHTDRNAAEIARNLNAHALTVGHNVMFEAGQFAPETWKGKRLLAHELIHTIQQGNTSPNEVQLRQKGGSRLSSRVMKDGGAVAGNFPFRLEVNSLPCSCDNLRFEQFVSGGFTLYGPRRIGGRESHRYDSLTHRWMPLTGTRPKPYGLFIQDLLPGMSVGPNPVKNSPADVKCDRERYMFRDAPGFTIGFGHIVGNILFDGIVWGVKFHHKLWCTGQELPFLVRTFRLVGGYFRGGKDGRKLYSG